MNIKIYGMNYDKLTDEEVKKLESIERRLLKIDKEVKELGLTVLLHDGNLHLVREGEDKSQHPTNEQIMHTVSLRYWDRIEW